MVIVDLRREWFEGADDLLEVAEHDPVVVGEPVVPVVVGGGDEPAGLVGLMMMGGQELDGGLEVGAGEAGVGVRAVLLGRSTAEPVGETGLDAGEVVFDPLGVGGRRIRFEG